MLFALVMVFSREFVQFQGAGETEASLVEILPGLKMGLFPTIFEKLVFHGE